MKLLFENQQTRIWITEDNKLSLEVLGIVCEYPLEDARDLNMAIHAIIEKMTETENKKKPLWKRLFGL
jgi:hypothetical protein